jgi:hypothetical protein
MALGRICEAGLASSLNDAMRQPMLLANDVMAMRSYEVAREHILDPAVKAKDIPDDAIHGMAKQVQFYRLNGRWMGAPKADG